ncbi:TIR domain-containing protein [Dolichospermum sp. LEGE 00240]|uniref:TIR domain-containing protein n=1 Tax=Dolichospermum sp. LEGE 00240 TaxID=1828603 RepID=UPI00187EAA95|nr:TIR domain-containing protein [Dolichospermum sp. LEGE 00240]MBE9248504.1 TIR domain-containing protein [Dolichospermum sp. LEGE 00240]
MAEFDVFLAHNSIDKPVVKVIYEALKKRGITSWLDGEEIRPGSLFQDAIQKGIPLSKSAAIFIGKSGLGMWQGLELKVILSMCLKQNIPVIPVLLPEVSDLPPDMLFLKEFNYINIYDGEIVNKIVNKRILDLLQWGITGKKSEDIPAQQIKPKPGKIPNKEKLVDLVIQDIYDRKDNPYTDATIWFEAIEKIIDNVVDAISENNDKSKDKILPLLGQIPIFTAYRNSQELLINKYIMNQIKNKLEKKGKSKGEIVKIIRKLLFNEQDTMEKHKFLKNNYTAGNILNLLLQLYEEKDFKYRDLSEMDIWGVDFRDAILTGVDFNDSDLKNCIFTQPLGCIHSIAFNADGNYFATGDAHGLIRVHNTENLALCFFEKGAGNQIWSVAFSLGTNSQRFALAAEDGSVKLFEIENLTSGKLNFKETHSWRETGRVLSVAFSLDAESNILAFGGDGNNAITVYRIKENEMIHLAASNVSCMTFIDNSILYSCSQEGDFIGWDLSTRNPQIFYQERKRHKKLIRCIAFNATKEIIATGSEDGELKIFHTNTRTNLEELELLDEDKQKYDYKKNIKEIRTLAFSCDGSILAIGCICKNTPEQSEDKDKSEDKNKSEHKILLFDLTGDKWKLIDTLDNSRSENQDHNGHTHLIRSIAFSPNTDKPRFLISGGDGRTVKLWDWNKDQKKWNCQDNLRGYANRVWSVAFSSNKQIFACGCEDNKIYIWNYNDRTHIPIPIHPTSKHTDWVWSVAFNHDGTLLASASEDKTIGLWQWQFKDNKWQYINCKPEDRSQTNHPLNTKHNKRVRCVAFHPTKNILASTGNDNIVILWDLTNLNNIEVLSRFTNHTDRVLSLAFSPDGRYLANSSRDKTIRLIEILDNNQELKSANEMKQTVLGEEESCHQDQVHSIAFITNTQSLLSSEKQESQNRYLLVSGGFDRQLILWEINSDNENPQMNKLCYVNEGQRILSVACNPTKPIVASTGHNCIITLWEIKKTEKEDKYELKQIKQLKGHKGAVESVVFTPDGQRLISCGQDQTITAV